MIWGGLTKREEEQGKRSGWHRCHTHINPCDTTCSLCGGGTSFSLSPCAQGMPLWGPRVDTGCRRQSWIKPAYVLCVAFVPGSG